MDAILREACQQFKDMLPWSKFFGEYGFSHLHNIAIGHLPLDIEEAIRANHLNPNQKDEIGRTPLRYAALQGNTTNLGAILRAGADLNVQSCKGNTALIWACFSHSSESVRLLLRYGASLNDAVSREVFGPIHALTIFGQFDEDSRSILELLLARGADINAENNPRHSSTVSHAVSVNNVEALRLLIENGADINLPDDSDDVPPFDAVAFMRNESLELLLSHRVNHLHVSNNGFNVLHWLAMHGNATCAMMLNRAKLTGFDPEARDQEGRTPYRFYATP